MRIWRFNKPFGAGVPEVFWRSLMLVAACLTLLVPLTAAGEEEFLPPEQAFRFSATMPSPGIVEVHFVIAPGYYMYRERFRFDADPASVRIGDIDYPPGVVKFDETFQKEMELYRDAVTLQVPVRAADGGPATDFALRITSQGCADKGLCYPPMESFYSAGQAPTAGGASSPQRAIAQGNARTSLSSLWAARENVNALSAQLQQAPVWLLAAGFVLLGLSLAFTPCVLPMVPILSAMIVGQQGRSTRARGLAMSGAYVAGMALVYTVAGVLTALAGASFTAALQKPPVIGLFAGLMVILALATFGAFELQLPAFIRNRFATTSGGGGTLGGAFAMGAASCVIVGPCVTAPLAGVLALIAHAGTPWLGGLLLLSLALGMGLPLLLIGAGAGTLLPKAGVWMEGVRRIFGILLLAVALWIANPILPEWLTMLFWAALLVVGAAFIGAYDRVERPASAPQLMRKGLGLLMSAAGILMLAGLLAGERDPLRPLGFVARGNVEVTKTHLPFRQVRSVDELDAILRAAGKPVLLDFYADWCVSCKEMERLTFSDPQVRAALDGWVLLQVDVTANDSQDQTLLKRFGLFGPPGIILFDAAGEEIRGHRVVGFQDAQRFLGSLRDALAMSAASAVSAR